MIAWLFILSTAACAGENLAFQRSRIDLGRVRASGVITATFPFRASGDATIVELRPGCGCLQPTLLKKSYRAGESGEIKLEIHATSQAAGKKRFPLSVSIRDPLERIVELAVDADLDADLSVEPSNLLLYLADDAPLRRTITVSDRRGAAPRILQASSSAPWIQAKAVEANGVANASLIELVVHNAPLGKHDERIELQTSDPENPRLEIPVMVRREGRLRATPTSLRMHAPSRAGASSRGIILLTDSRQEAVQIESASSNHPQVKVRWSKDRQPKAKVDVFLESTAEPIAGDVQLTIQVALPIRTELKIPLTID